MPGVLTMPNLGVRIHYPPTWTAVAGYSGDRFGGADGFVSVDAAGLPAGPACLAGAQHILHPFGSRPTTVTLTVEGQPACLVTPSPDAPRDQGFVVAELAVTYPIPLGPYASLILYADMDHIRELASTIEFLPVPGPSP